VATAAGASVAAIAPLAVPLLAVAAAAASVSFAVSRISSTAKELGGWDAVLRDFKDWGSGKGPALATDAVNENSPQWKKDKAAGRSVSVAAPTVINVHGVDQDTGKKAGADVHRNMVNAHERAAMQGG
jgi:hypothetical protein